MGESRELREFGGSVRGSRGVCGGIWRGGLGVGGLPMAGALTGALAGGLGAVDGAGVVGVEVRLQKGDGHRGSQAGQALTQRGALPAGRRGRGEPPCMPGPPATPPPGMRSLPAPTLLTALRRGSWWCPASRCCTASGSRRPAHRPLRAQHNLGTGWGVQSPPALGPPTAPIPGAPPLALKLHPQPSLHHPPCGSTPHPITDPEAPPTAHPSLWLHPHEAPRLHPQPPPIPMAPLLTPQ